MKSVLILFLIFTASKQADQYEPLEPKSYQFECIDDTHVDADLVIQLKAGKIWEKNFPSLKKWVLCVLTKSRLMSAQGVYKFDVAMGRIQESDKEAAEKLINECLPTTAMLPEEIAWEYTKCHHKKDRKGNFSTITAF